MSRLFVAALIVCGLAVPARAGAQIAWASTAVSDGGSTQLVMSYPASIAAGDLLVACVANKYPANDPDVPSGWAIPTNGQASGGSGSAGADSGDAYATVMVKVAVGDESGGSLTVDIPSGNSAVGNISRFTKTAAAWSYVAVNGTDTTAGTDWSVTAAADPGVTAGDIVVACSGINGSVGVSYSGEAMTQTGITWGTEAERRDNAASDGDNSAVVISTHAVSSGTSSAAPVFTMTAAASGANGPAGVTVFLRLREISTTGCGGLMLLGVGRCD